MGLIDFRGDSLPRLKADAYAEFDNPIPYSPCKSAGAPDCFILYKPDVAKDFLAEKYPLGVRSFIPAEADLEEIRSLIGIRDYLGLVVFNLLQGRLNLLTQKADEPDEILAGGKPLIWAIRDACVAVGEAQADDMIYSITRVEAGRYKKLFSVRADVVPAKLQEEVAAARAQLKAFLDAHPVGEHFRLAYPTKSLLEAANDSPGLNRAMLIRRQAESAASAPISLAVTKTTDTSPV